MSKRDDFSEETLLSLLSIQHITKDNDKDFANLIFNTEHDDNIPNTQPPKKGQAEITHHFFKQSAHDAQKNNISEEELNDALIPKTNIYKLLTKPSNATALEFAYQFHMARIHSMTPAIFRYLSEDVQNHYLQSLKHSYYVFCLYHQLAVAENNTTRANNAKKLLDRTANYIHYIKDENTKLHDETESQKNEPGLGIYLFLKNIPAFFQEVYNDFKAEKVGFLTQNLSELNGVRLYWVWTGGWLSQIASMISEKLFNQPNFETAVNAPGSVTGYMSWVLYFVRFGLGFGKIVEHGFFPGADEANIPWEIRVQRQWDQRKYSLVNDFFWGFANMACHLKLNGPIWLNYGGNVVTVLLLIMDLVISTIKFQEKQKVIEESLKKYDNEIKELNSTSLYLTQQLLPNNIEQNNNKSELEAQLLAIDRSKAELEKARAKFYQDWIYEKKQFINNIIYSAGLAMSFALFSCALIPPTLIAAPTMLLVGTIGMGLCFIITVIYETVDAGITLSKNSKEIKDIEAEIKKLNVDADTLKQKINLPDRADKTKDENELARIYLLIKSLEAERETKTGQYAAEIKKLVLTTFMKAFVPAIIFSLFMFVHLPIGANIGILAGILVLSVVVYKLISALAPDEAKKALMNDADFRAFKTAEKDNNPPMVSLEDLSPGPLTALP